MIGFGKGVKLYQKSEKARIWFLGREVEVECCWCSAEYLDGYILQGSYWEILEIIDIETNLPIDLVAQARCGDPEAFTWRVQPSLFEDDNLMRAVEAAIEQSLNHTFYVDRSYRDPDYADYETCFPETKYLNLKRTF